MKPPRIKLVEYPPLIRVFTQAVATELSIDLYICVQSFNLQQLIFGTSVSGKSVRLLYENDFTCSLNSEKEDFTVIKDGYVF